MKPSKKQKRRAEKASQKRAKNKLSEIELETLEHLLSRLRIHSWDVILIGDGSGSNWDREAGWATVSIEKLTMERVVYYGAVNRGTVNLAEMMAYIQPLDFLSGREADLRKKKKAPIRAFNIHIITDSEYCRSTGNIMGGKLVAKNAGLWSVFDTYVRHGFVLHWHHVRGHTDGEGCALNKYCDKLSKLARKHFKGVDFPEQLVDQGKEVRTVYEINPADEL